ncbi:MAG: hypothetical protein ABJU26_15245, partial [Flavobacteriaceae bacterium]
MQEHLSDDRGRAVVGSALSGPDPSGDRHPYHGAALYLSAFGLCHRPEHKTAAAATAHGHQCG